MHHDPGTQFVLSSFDFDAPVLAEVPQDLLWRELPVLAARLPGKLIAGVFDPFSQLERSFSAALRRQRLPVLCLPPERAPLLRTLCRELPLGAVVALWRTRDLLEPWRAELPDIYVQYVLAPEEEPERLANTGFVRHSAPGITQP